jgi:hypothetical protein
VGINVPSISGNFTTMTRASGCRHRIPISESSGNHKAHSLKETEMTPVEQAGDGPTTRVGLLTTGWNHAVAGRTETGILWHQGVPDSSLYDPLMLVMRRIAGSFALLLAAAQILCSFPGNYFYSFPEGMHI